MNNKKIIPALQINIILEMKLYSFFRLEINSNVIYKKFPTKTGSIIRHGMANNPLTNSGNGKI